MKIVQSFWTKPFLANTADVFESRANGGWTHRLLNYYSWTLSSLQIKKFYPEIELYTDTLGKSLLIDKLQLPYTKVYTVLDELSGANDALWALGKLKTYECQRAPFMHVDSDVFIFKAFDADFISSGLIAQNKESSIVNYSNTFNQLCKTYGYVPDCFLPYANLPLINCCNAGILGGNNIAFFQAFTKEATAFLVKNEAVISENPDRLCIGNLNMIFEQVLFYYLAQQSHEPITYLFPDVIDVPPQIGYFHDLDRFNGFVHCLGDYKKDKLSYTVLEEILRTEYVQYFNRIHSLMAAGEI